MVDLSIPTPQIPPPRSSDPAHPPAAGRESKEINNAQGWLTEVQRPPMTILPPHHWAQMEINQGGKSKPYSQDHRSRKTNPRQYRSPNALSSFLPQGIGTGPFFFHTPSCFPLPLLQANTFPPVGVCQGCQDKAPQTGEYTVLELSHHSRC